MREASLLLAILALGCSGNENGKTKSVAPTVDSKAAAEQVSPKAAPKSGQAVSDAGVTQRANEAREKRAAVKKLIEDRKAELAKAKIRSEAATAEALQTHEAAEKATATEEQAYRIYQRAAQLDKSNSPNLPDGIRYDAAKKAASEALKRARQVAAEKAAALESTAEIQSAVRRAEELLAQLAGE